jgi:PAS domain S-box-containing protein
VASPGPNGHRQSAALTAKICSLLETILQHETAVHAYEKWLARGRPHDSAIKDWLEAEAELAEFRDLADRLTEPNAVLREYVMARERLQGVVQETEDRSRQLRGLAEAALAVSTVSSQWELLQVVANRARALVGAHLAAAVLVPSGDWSAVVHANSLSDKYAAYRSYDAKPDGSGLSGRVCQEGCTLRLTQAEMEVHPHWRGFGAESGRHPPLRGLLAVPLLSREGRPLGLLQLSDRFEGDFTPQDELILTQLGQLTAAALEMRQTQLELEARIHERTAELTRASEALRLEAQQHQKTEEERQHYFTLLQAVIEGTTDAVYVKDLAGRYLMINTAGARFLGKTVKEVIGKDDTAVFSPETARQIMAQDRQVLASGQTQTLEDVGTAAGITRTYLSTKGPYRDKQGDVIGLIGISRDITERKQAARQLRAEHAVTKALAISATLSEAARHILQAICENLGWDMGFFWKLDPRREVLRCIQVWHVPGVIAPELEKTTCELAYSHGMGLPGQVWARGEVIWIANVQNDPNILYRGPVAYQEGLRAAIAFPLRSGDEVLGVVEFFSREMGEPDTALLDALTSITTQISQFMERQRVEQDWHARQREFALAREIQQGLLPREAPAVPGLTMAGISYPAQETGGDYYDFFFLADGALAVAVGDASGHGIGPALLMTNTRAYLRALALTHSDLGQVLALINRRLSEDMAEDRFVTLLLARLDPGGRKLTHSSAGHWPGFVLDYRGWLKATLDSTGTVLGFDPQAEFPAGSEVSLELGDVVLLCTDGLKEARAKRAENEEFGKERILDVVRSHRHESASRIVQALCEAVHDFAGPEQLDDMTAVAIKVE